MYFLHPEHNDYRYGKFDNIWDIAYLPQDDGFGGNNCLIGEVFQQQEKIRETIIYLHQLHRKGTVLWFGQGFPHQFLYWAHSVYPPQSDGKVVSAE